MEDARAAGPDDLAALRTLEEQARASLVGQRGGDVHLRRHPAHGEALEALVVDPAHHVLVGTIDEVPVGFAVVRLDELEDTSTIGTLTDLFVHPDARGVGVGACLLDAAIAWSAAAGCTGLDGTALPGDRATKNFFESYGMVARALTTHLDLTAIERSDGGEGSDDIDRPDDGEAAT